MQHESDYFLTFIAVADDCPVDRGVVPTGRQESPTVAMLQYEMIASTPHGHTQADVLFLTWLRRQPSTVQSGSAASLSELRQQFFAKPQACLRASPLPKRHGWGLLFDAQGRVALVGRESRRYDQLASGSEGAVKVVKAMRSSRV